MSSAPNILYIFTDQQAASAMSCAGNDHLHTPNMDRLAAEGARCEAACCAYPLCGPSRASMFTGLMPHQVGADDNGLGIDPTRRDRELGNLLRAGGYDCAYAGKWHVPEIEIVDGHGFEKICGFSDWDVPDACAEYLRRDHERPFFLVASFDNPHNICEWSRQCPLPWGPIPEVPVSECPNLPGNFARSPYEPELIRDARRASPRLFRGDRLAPDDWRRYRHAYFRLVEKVDAAVGRILDALDDAGLADDTLVVFSSDHGDGHGAHMWNQKWVLWEESVGVPLLFRLPGAIAPGTLIPQPVSNGLDLFPTLCDYTGIPAPADLPGRSLRPLLTGETGDWRPYIAAETAFGEAIPTTSGVGRMIRTARCKYVCWSWGKHREELYDLETDPGETVNLALEGRYATLLQEHRDYLAEWIERTDDRRFGRHYSHPDQYFPVPGAEFQR